MNPCIYQIQTYSYTPSKKVVTLEERKKKFRTDCANALAEMNLYFPNWLKLKWVDKWEAMNAGGKKMAWEMEKVFDIKARLRTFHRNSKQWDAKLWEQEKKQTYTPPKKQKIDYGNIDYSKFKNDRTSEVTTLGERIKKQFER